MSYYPYMPPMMPPMMPPPMMPSPMMPSPMMPSPMMPSPMMPMMPTTRGGKIQSLKSSIKPSPVDITLYLFGLLFIIAISLAAAVSSGSATFTKIPFDSIKGNTNNYLNIKQDKNLLINVTDDVTEGDYTINVSQPITTKSSTDTDTGNDTINLDESKIVSPIFNMESSDKPIINFNRYNSIQPVQSKMLSKLKSFGVNTPIAKFNAYTHTSIGKNKPPAQKNVAFMRNIRSLGFLYNNAITFATITPTSDVEVVNPPQTNLYISSNGGINGQFPRSISYNPGGVKMLNLKQGTYTLERNTLQIFGAGVTYDIIYNLPEPANLGDYINVVFVNASGAGKFKNGSLSFQTSKGLGNGSTILGKYPPTTIGSNFTPGDRLKISNSGQKGVIIKVGGPTRVQLSNIVLKFVYVNSSVKGAFSSNNFVQTWIAECHTKNPNIDINFF